MNILQNKYVNKEIGGFNVAIVPVVFGTVTTIAVSLTPMVGSALAVVVAVMAPMVMYGVYHEVARAVQNLKASVLTKRTKIIRLQHSIKPTYRYSRRSIALTR